MLVLVVVLLPERVGVVSLNHPDGPRDVGCGHGKRDRPVDLRDPGSEASILLKIGLLPHLSGYFDIWDFHVWHPGISICSAPTPAVSNRTWNHGYPGLGYGLKITLLQCFDYNTLELWVCFSAKTKQTRSHLHFAPKNFKNRWVDLENWTFEVANWFQQFTHLSLASTRAALCVLLRACTGTCTVHAGTNHLHNARCDLDF